MASSHQVKMYTYNIEQAWLYKYAKYSPKTKGGRCRADDTITEVLEYALWVNSIVNSRECIRHHGPLYTPEYKDGGVPFSSLHHLQVPLQRQRRICIEIQ